MGTGALSSRAPWRPASEDESVERVRFGPFLTREVVKRPDGSRLVYSSRRQRKGLPPQVEGAAAPAHRRVMDVLAEIAREGRGGSAALLGSLVRA